MTEKTLVRRLEEEQGCSPIKGCDECSGEQGDWEVCHVKETVNFVQQARDRLIERLTSDEVCDCDEKGCRDTDIIKIVKEVLG